MSNFVRTALKTLSGNHFKLWACLLEYRESLTLQQFSEYTALDLATVKRILPDLVGPDYLSKDTTARPHRYTLASQLCLRFEDEDSKAQNTLFRRERESQNAPFIPSKVAIRDGLYLEPLPQIGSIIDTESDRIPESRKMPLSTARWQPENADEWRKSNEDHARQSAQAVGDRASSFAWHIKMWAHVRRTDAIHKTRLEAQIVSLALQLKTERESSGRPQGARFNTQVNRMLTREGHPLGRKEDVRQFAQG